VHNLGKITLGKLPLGEYQLNINDINISIRVVKGKVMDVNDFVVLENGNIKISIDNIKESILWTFMFLIYIR